LPPDFFFEVAAVDPRLILKEPVRAAAKGGFLVIATVVIPYARFI
jgi:hypothetical protein